jgi:hypothetical protein
MLFKPAMLSHSMKWQKAAFQLSALRDPRRLPPEEWLPWPMKPDKLQQTGMV